VIKDHVTNKTYGTFQGETESMEELLEDMDKEIQDLKQSIKEVVELLSEEVDVFSDKATEHDINAYIELQELDNKDAYYMATATKEAIKLLRGIVDD
jgi:archaellum component FlaC